MQFDDDLILHQDNCFDHSKEFLEGIGLDCVSVVRALERLDKNCSSDQVNIRILRRISDVVLTFLLQDFRGEDRPLRDLLLSWAGLARGQSVHLVRSPIRFLY